MSHIQRQTLYETLSAVQQDPEKLAAIHADSKLPETVIDWLARLQLLEGLPFNYMVPDPAMLPKESIRFFQLDPNWITAFVEGAFNIGSATAGDLAHDQATISKVSNPAPAQVVSGFLIRSGVVKGWPNLGVIAYDAAGQRMDQVLRMDHLSPNTLLFLVAGDGPLDHIDVHEHPEGLHFGVTPTLMKPLRYVTVPQGAPTGSAPGDQIDGQPVGPVPLRSGGKRVMQISQLASDLEAALKTASAAGTAFTSAEFALQMIEGVQLVRFCNKNSTTCDTVS